MSKQPPGLSVLFFTEMWERFGFYILQGLLVLYMTQHLDFTDDRSYEILGAFTALAYIMPVLGGYMADYVLGYRRAIVIGNILLVIGYIIVLCPAHWCLYLGLATVTIGTGFFKPNVSTMVGTLYEPSDPRRETGFTIFYVGINLGVLIGTSIVGFVQQKLGWTAAFGMASLGLIIALYIFWAGRNKLGTGGFKPVDIQKHQIVTKALHNNYIAALITLGFIAFAMLLIINSTLANVSLIIASILLLCIILMKARKYTADVRYKLYALLSLIAVSVFFWAIYFQMFFSVILFIERGVNRYVAGMELPAILFISVESIGVIVCGFILAKLWHHLALRNRNPSTPFKFSFAMILIGFAFGLLWLGILLAHGHLVNPMWVVIAFIIIAIGELALSAIGLSAVTVLAPKDLVAFLMGVWFLSLGWGGKLAGILAKVASVPDAVVSLGELEQYYSHAFGLFFVIAIAVGLISFSLVPMVKKMMEGRSPRSLV